MKNCGSFPTREMFLDDSLFVVFPCLAAPVCCEMPQRAFHNNAPAGSASCAAGVLHGEAASCAKHASFSLFPPLTDGGEYHPTLTFAYSTPSALMVVVRRSQALSFNSLAA